MGNNVLVIGGGGREHALCWKLAQSPKVSQVFVAPGNVGIAEEKKVTTANVDIKDFKAIITWCREHSVSLVVVGPEDPLSNGISDALTKEGILCFGPSKAAAQIECNKDWAKSFMDKHGIPTARWKSFTSAQEAKEFIQKSEFPALVVKASGLAAGKGVVVASSKDEACQAVDTMLTQRQFGEASDTLVIEELLCGEEVSVLAFSDGKNVQLMLPAQDHKRLLAGDQGPNTGGMGAYCPAPFISATQLEEVEKTVLAKAVSALAKDGIPFIGVLYAGLMMTKEGPKVLEFNCRFGDPETQVILPLLESDLYDVMLACCKGTLSSVKLEWRPRTYAVGVVLASKDYPASSSKGQTISGVKEVCAQPDHLVFHSGTATVNNELVTNGGRVLIAVSLAVRLPSAAAHATCAANAIKFDGVQSRTDIAHKGIIREVLCKGNLTYKASGVDICAGDTLVSNIKPCAASTKRPGCISSIGGFGGVFDLKAAGYKDALLVSGTDGVGTKLRIAQECAVFDTIGEDLVAMCVNDVLAHAAEPLFFLDYFACGILDVGVASDVVEGIANGCKLAGCSLIGGETAEMPGLYEPGDFDIAGFSVGAVERGQQLPRIQDIKEGDVVIGLPSSGLHSNGFSLVRRVMAKVKHSFAEPAPFSETGNTFGKEFLTPTRIYPLALLPVLRSGKVKAYAHITGGGLTENIPRILPDHLGATLFADKWKIPPVFAWLAAAGEVCAPELLRTLNCGLGCILVVSSEDQQAVSDLLGTEKHYIVGSITKFNQGCRILVKNFTEEMEKVMRGFLPDLLRSGLSPIKKRVGVLISGTGSNLQALLEHTNNPTICSAAEIAIVISNKASAQGLERAKLFNVPTKVIPHQQFNSRLDFDHEMDRVLQEAGVEFICLAGFMRLLSAEFVKKWRGRILNVHPALLPLFKGMHAHRQALQAGVKVTGCSVHFVEEDVDSGAIIVQEAVPIKRGDTEEILQERVKIAEHKAFPRALEMLARGDIYLDEHGQLAYRDYTNGM